MNTITKISKKISVLFLGLIIATVAVAQDEDGGLSISGSVDTYYKYDFSGYAQRGMNYSNWFGEDQNSVSIGMIDVALSHEMGKASFVGEFALGPRAIGEGGSGQGTAPGTIQNLYVSYALTDALSVTGGFMGTFVGYEVISPAANFNYSASYLFSNGPFQNAGVKLDYAISDSFGVMFGVFSSYWDSYLADPGLGMNSIGAQVYLAPVDGWDVYLNFITGSLYSQWDITTGYQISDAFYLGANISQNMEYGGDEDGGFFGFALYPQYALTDAAAIGVRFENWTPEFTDAPSINSFTISGNLKAGNLTFIPELRIDSASEDIFYDGDPGDTANTSPAGSFTELLFAAVYSF